VPERYLRGSLRLTLGTDNTMDDVEQLLAVLPPAVEKIRGLAPAR
jgi:cysteine sulfinate desulfinase/cysteine desulfurase-like protein